MTDDVVRRLDLIEERLSVISDTLRNNCQDTKAIMDALAGDHLHPNGIASKVNRLEEDVRGLSAKLDRWRAWAVGVGIGGGMAGAGSIFGLLKAFGGA